MMTWEEFVEAETQAQEEEYMLNRTGGVPVYEENEGSFAPLEEEEEEEMPF